MLRLLQGDVGSGKTAVAAVAMALVADAGRQAALLAPTDLLARQHAATLRSLLEPLGHTVTLLTGSMPAAARREALDLLAAPVDRTTAGESAGRIVVGTHALFQESVEFADLRLVVVDEQHRFGVAEREALTAKGVAPHVLLMTATPIPRTLGQILHADLDVSNLHAAPIGRIPIRTAIRDPRCGRAPRHGRAAGRPAVHRLGGRRRSPHVRDRAAGRGRRDDERDQRRAGGGAPARQLGRGGPAAPARSGTPRRRSRSSTGR